MTCPLCFKIPISFLKFAFKVDPRFLCCDECGAELRISPRWLRLWWASLIFGGVVALASIILRRIIGWGLLTNLAGLIVIAALLSWYFWRSAVYEVKHHKARSEPDLELP
jgi:hypothetical protein